LKRKKKKKQQRREEKIEKRKISKGTGKGGRRHAARVSIQWGEHG